MVGEHKVGSKEFLFLYYSFLFHFQLGVVGREGMAGRSEFKHNAATLHLNQ